jgi:hypothetical protein
MASRRVFPKRIKYEITQDDIDLSTPTCENCPHARALKRHTGSKRVRVYGGRVSIIGSDTYRYYYSTPSYVHEFEVARDQVGRDACNPGFAVINYIERTKIMASVRQDQINKNRQVRAARQLATGDTVLPYRTRTGTATGLRSVA